MISNAIIITGKGLYELKNLSGQILKKKANVCRLKLFNERSLSGDDQQPPEGDQQPPERVDQQPPEGDQPPERDHQQPPEGDQPPERDHQQPPEGDQQPPEGDQQPPERDPKSTKCKTWDVFKKVSVVSQLPFGLLLYL